MTMMRYCLGCNSAAMTFDREGVVKDSDGFASEISPFAFEQLGCVLQLRGPMASNEMSSSSGK